MSAQDVLWVASQLPWRYPDTALARELTPNERNPIALATYASTSLCPSTRTPAVGPCMRLGQSGGVLTTAGRPPPPAAPPPRVPPAPGPEARHPPGPDGKTHGCGGGA